LRYILKKNLRYVEARGPCLALSKSTT